VSSDASPIEPCCTRSRFIRCPSLPSLQAMRSPAATSWRLHCDLVVASTSARFGMSLAQIRAGAELVPGQEAVGGGGPCHHAQDPAARRSHARTALYDLGVISHKPSPTISRLLPAT